ncbi:MAG: DNA replication and repair protein RecF [Syntrophomonadaceae bacterium]|nr:DNA replication and repair protein RecF [Syntrophomonadaceae bacterium]
MEIKQIKIRNFRNIEKLDYVPCRGLNLFIGDNGQGKTNILEALFVLSTGSSFRTSVNRNLLKYDTRRFLVKARYQCREKLFDAVLCYEMDKKKLLKINSRGASHKNPNCLKVVLFNPDDLYLVKGSPAGRRKFVDFFLQQISAEYLYNLERYTKILNKKNNQLKKEKIETKKISIIDEIFVESAVRLILARIKLVKIIDKIAESLYREITDGQNSLRIKYALSFPIDDNKFDFVNLKEKFLEKIESRRQEEIKRKKTLIGPHLDDINIYQDGKIARVFASQGQQRSIAVALKLAEVYAFQELMGFFPVFLMDEVLAELDGKRKQLLVNHLAGAGFQSFLTSVDISGINCCSAQLSSVKNGCVT